MTVSTRSFAGYLSQHQQRASFKGFITIPSMTEVQLQEHPASQHDILQEQHLDSQRERISNWVSCQDHHESRVIESRSHGDQVLIVGSGEFWRNVLHLMDNRSEPFTLTGLKLQPVDH